ncbi:MAG: glycosyl hydrolase 115 family protein [Ignavibacteria bacterium]|nr:glycosyl hydrolase 115 family protein [Ignavibacteria bacterium]
MKAYIVITAGKKHSSRSRPKGLVFRRYATAILLIISAAQLFSAPQVLTAQRSKSYVSTRKSVGAFTLSASGRSAPLVVSSQDYPAVKRVIRDLQADILRVSRAESALFLDSPPKTKEFVLVGTLGRNPLVDELVRNGKIKVDGVAGKWETFLIQVVEKPFPGVDRTLVVVGSDKRGTVFGVYDLCEKIGVSPWYWWADVPVKSRPNLFVGKGRYTQGEPAVKYRGIFINDEAPALSGWTHEKFGGFNHNLYEKVFELILRMKGNYLWPAMWGRAFYDDDSLNPKLADEYGIVIATSHHEPMMRAHDEWRRYGKGAWNYEKNDSILRNFWQQGIKRMGSYESVVTLGMRGDGDEPMSENANISLLERIVKNQRQILGDVTGKDVSTIPQVWALYKEVQEYYDKGMRVPDDVTLLLCDDNWGNIRKLPRLIDAPRKGGYGIYYHYDYVGGPRNYKWLNTNQIARVWEQMHLAYKYGVDRIWIVNVGDIKPMEFPTQFFLDYAWNPDKWPAERLPQYTRDWAEQQFGSRYAREIADIITKYTQYNSRRKPELLSPNTYSLTNYREAETVVAEYNTLAQKAQRISASLPVEYRDAFYQLVLHPVLACSNLNEMYVTIGKNNLYAKQGRAITNDLAEQALKLFAKDSAMSYYYNKTMASGKWNHMMDQTHIGYTYWQQPERDSMPEVRRVTVPSDASMGIAIEGSESWWPAETKDPVLPEFDRYHKQKYFIDIFNRGMTPFRYSIKIGKPWVHVSSTKGKITVGDRLWVSVDWKKAPTGTSQVPIMITGPEKETVTVQTVIKNPSSPAPDNMDGFVESNGYVSIEAHNYSRAVGSSAISWQRIPELGRTLSAVTPIPVTAASQTPGGEAPRLEYTLYLSGKGDVRVAACLSPTLNFHNNEGLRYAISFDDQPPQLVNMHAGKSFQDWEESVRNNISILLSKHTIGEPGRHVLKFWMVDPGVVLQKLVVETGEVKPGYLGPPESVIISKKK